MPAIVRSAESKPHLIRYGLLALVVPLLFLAGVLVYSEQEQVDEPEASLVDAPVRLCEGDANRCDEADVRYQLEDDIDMNLGLSMAAGFINDDGLADLIVGAPGGNRVYIYYGVVNRSLGSSPKLPVDAADVILTGPESFGFSVAVGNEHVPTEPLNSADPENLNQTIINALIIGAPDSSQAFVFHGNSFDTCTDSEGADAPCNITVQSNVLTINGAPGEEVGHSVAIGPVDTTCPHDFIIGAPGAEISQDSPAAGAVYAVSFDGQCLCSGSGQSCSGGVAECPNGNVCSPSMAYPVSVDLNGSPSEEVSIRKVLGSLGNEALGEFLAVADFFPDLPGYEVAAGAVGRRGDADDNVQPGRVYVIPFATLAGDELQLDDNSVDDVLCFQGESNNDYFGFSLVAGMFDGDDYYDLAVAAILADRDDPPVQSSGAVYVVTGDALRNEPRPSAGCDSVVSVFPSEGVTRIFGERTWDEFGFALAAADIDHDGGDDLVVSARWYERTRMPADTNQIDEGAVYVFFGGTEFASWPETAGEVGAWIYGGDLAQSTGGPYRADELGFALAAGDFNAASLFPDIAVSSVTQEHVYLVSLNNVNQNEEVEGSGQEVDSEPRDIRDPDDDGDGYDDDLEDCNKNGRFDRSESENEIGESSFLIPNRDVAVTITSPTHVECGGSVNVTVFVTNDSPFLTVFAPDPWLTITFEDEQQTFETQITAEITFPGLNEIGRSVTFEAGEPVSIAPPSGRLPAEEPIKVELTLRVVDDPGVDAMGSKVTARVRFVEEELRAKGEDYEHCCVSAKPPNPACVISPNTATTDQRIELRCADLNVTKTGPSQASAGQNLTYVIDVANSGSLAAKQVTVTDSLPEKVVYESAMGVNWSCSHDGSETGGTVTCLLVAEGGGDRPLGGGTTADTLNIVAQIPGDTDGTNIENKATVSSAVTAELDASDNMDAWTTSVVLMTDLAVTKTDGLTSAVPGERLTYTITVTNNGPSNATGARVTDTFDPSFFDVTNVVWDCEITSGTGACGTPTGTGNINTLVDLEAQSVATFRATADILTGALGTITNTAEVEATNDMIPENNTDEDDDTVLNPEADLAVTKDDGVTSAEPGTELAYTITVTNNGPSDSAGARVIDEFDETIFDLANLTWNCAITAGTGECLGGTGDTLGNIDTTVNLQSGAVATFMVTAPLLSGATGTISNTASATTVNETDSTPENNSATDDDTVLDPQADLAVTKDDEVLTAVPGTELTYTITVTNNGPSDSIAAILTDVFDETIFDVPNINWSCAISGTGGCRDETGMGDIETTLDLQIDAVATFTVTAPILADARGTVSNTATAETVNETDPFLGNNAATDDNTALTPQADLVVTKDDGVTSALSGTSLTYTITVTNNGPSNSSAATVVDNFDPSIFHVTGVTWTCSTMGTGVCAAASGSGNIITTVDLEKDAVATFMVTAPILSMATGTILNEATATTVNEVDPLPGNNSGVDNDTALSIEADLAVTKTDQKTAAAPGELLHYTITVTNLGNGDSTGARLTDDFSAAIFDEPNIGWSCSITTGTGVCGNPSGSGDIDATLDLTAGSVATFRADAPILPTASGTISNTATVVEGAQTDPNQSNNSDTDDDTVLGNVADLRTTMSDNIPDSVVAGDGTIAYAVTVFNDGPSDTEMVKVTDVLSEDLGFVSSTCPGTESFDPGTRTFLCEFAGIPADSFEQFSVNVEVLASARDSVTNQASSEITAGGVDPDPTNDSSLPVTTTVEMQADLALTKTDGVLAAVPGENLTYTIAVTNSGPSDSVGATVVDEFDPALFDVANIIWSCSITSGVGSCGNGSGAGDIATTVDLTSGSVATYSVTAPILSSALGTIANTATVTAVNETDEVPGNDSDTDNDTVLNPVSDLMARKTDGTTSAAPGEILTYTITVTNNGPSDSVDAAVDDEFDPAFFDVANISWSCSITSGVGACGSGSGAGDIATTVDLTSGSVATYSVTAPILSSALGTIANTATVTAVNETDELPGNDSGTDDDTVLNPVSDLMAGKTDGTTSAAPGENLTYAITVTNNGPSDSVGATVDDEFDPAFFDVANISWSCSITSGVGACGSGSGAGDIATTVDLTSGSVATYSVTAPILSSASGAIANTATVTAVNETDEVPGNDSDTDDDTVLNPVSDLMAGKTDGATSAVPGETLTYTITVTNNGPSDSVDATVDDEFDPAFFDVANINWSCSITMGTGACGSGSGAGDIATTVDLTSGSVATYSVTAPILSSANGAIANTATVTAVNETDEVPGNDSDTDNDTVLNPVSDLMAGKTDGTTSAAPGETLTYAITVTNNGPSDSVGATVVDEFDPAFFDVSNINWSCSITMGTGACGSGSGAGDIATTVDLTSGSVATYSVTAPILSSASGTIANTATVTAVNETDELPGNDSGTDDDTVLNPVSDLMAGKTDGTTSAAPGETLTYTITVTNNGPSDSVDAAVDDEFDPAFFDVANISWSCSITSGVGACGSGSGAGDIATTVDLTSGSVATYSVTAPILSSASGTISNTATVTAVNETDEVPGNDSGTDDDTVLNPVSDLMAGKTDGTTSAVPGENLTYTITVTNNGPGDSVGATVVDDFDPAFFDVSNTNWNCSITMGTGACGSGSGAGDIATTVDLTSGSVATYSVTAPILSSASGTIANTATVTAVNETDDVPGNDSGTDDDTVLDPVSDLMAGKTDGTTSAAPGENLTYTITVTNNGPSDSVDAAVDDEFDPAFFDVANINWSCSITMGTGSCGSGSGAGNIATTVDLTSGSVATYSVTAPILSSASGTISNTATVTAVNETDEVPGNDSDTDDDTVLNPVSDLMAGKTDGATSAVPGENLTYTITVTNNGPSDSVDAAVDDEFDPAFFDVANINWSCSITMGTGACASGSGAGNIATTVDLTSGSVATYSVTAPILSSASGTISNTATVTAVNETDEVPGNDSGTDDDTVLASEVDLEVTKGDGLTSIVAGTDLIYTITVTNSGPSDSIAATVTDTFDAGIFDLTSIAWNCAITMGMGSCGDPSGSENINTTVDLSVGSVATYSVTATVLPGATGTIVNEAEATPSEIELDPADNIGRDDDTVIGPPAPSIAQPRRPLRKQALHRESLSALSGSHRFGRRGPRTSAGSTSAGTDGPDLSAGPSPPNPAEQGGEMTRETQTEDTSTAGAASSPPMVDLSIRLAANAPGQDGASTYTLQVQNLSATMAASHPEVTSKLAEGVIFHSVRPQDWSCTTPGQGDQGGEVRCTRQTLAAGETAPAIAIRVTVPRADDFPVIETSVSGTEPDPDTTNNTADTRMEPQAIEFKPGRNAGRQPKEEAR